MTANGITSQCLLPTTTTPDILEAKLYVDGSPETSFTASLSSVVNTTSTANVKIGTDAQGRFFPGAIDEPRIYDRALTEAEIQGLYSAANQLAAAWHRRYFGNGLVDWSLDDDGDGGARLLEYAFGGEPWIANALVIDALAVHWKVIILRFVFPRRSGGHQRVDHILPRSHVTLCPGTSSRLPPGSDCRCRHCPVLNRRSFRRMPASQQKTVNSSVCKCLCPDLAAWLPGPTPNEGWFRCRFSGSLCSHNSDLKL